MPLRRAFFHFSAHQRMGLAVWGLVLLVPVVGVTYEFNRLVGAHDNVVTRILSAPGMWLQNFTTHEPDDSMIEVAIAAVTPVLPEKQEDARW